jgi:hypothetical protein
MYLIVLHMGVKGLLLSKGNLIVCITNHVPVLYFSYILDSLLVIQTGAFLSFRQVKS